jgi:hypothetical protein
VVQGNHFGAIVSLLGSISFGSLNFISAYSSLRRFVTRVSIGFITFFVFYDSINGINDGFAILVLNVFPLAIFFFIGFNRIWFYL